MSAPVKLWGDVSNALHVARLRHFREVGIGERLDGEGAFALVTGRTSNIEHNAVLAVERRRGIGPALVGTRVAEARRRGCDVAVLSATPDSQSFYERFGFTATHVRPRRWYYL